jgi:4-hydroxybenzoate polyprenyltransferase
VRDIKLWASVSRLHIIAIAAMGTLTFGWLFTGRYLFGVCAVCALDWFIVNLLNRVVDVAEDRQNRIVGADFADRHRRALTLLGAALLVGSLVGVAFVWPALTPYRLAYHALGLTYNWPLLPGRRRIKQLYFFKNTASAMGFMLTCFCYPLAAVGGVFLHAPLAPEITCATIAFTGAFFFLFELSYEVVYDLRDIDGDTLAHVRTYPVVHGARAAVRITDGLLVGACLALVIGYALHAVPWRIFILVCGPVIQAVVYKRALARGITSRDCVRITWLGAALLLAYHAWVLLKLPGLGLAL